MKILIIEDEKLLADSIQEFLNNKGFDTEAVYDGETGKEYAELGIYDLLILDVMMPGMDGIEAAQIIRRDCGENGTAPVMAALTANAMEGMREYFLEHGFQDFIAKPLDRKALNRLLLRWVPEKYRQAEKAEEEAAAAAAPAAARADRPSWRGPCSAGRR